jgi:adenylate cyclase
MAGRPVERKLAAILSGDVEGYSRLMGDDKVATVHTMTEYREAIASAVVRHGGRVVDAPRDNVLAEFPSVVDAVRCAVEMQGELSGPGTPICRCPAGCSFASAHPWRCDRRGPSALRRRVNIAARVEGLSEAGGICLSGTTYDQVEGKLPFGYDFLGEDTVKNIARPVRVYRLHLEPRAGPSSGERRARRQLVRWVFAGVATLVLLGAGGWAGRRWLQTPEPSELALP